MQRLKWLELVQVVVSVIGSALYWPIAQFAGWLGYEEATKSPFKTDTTGKTLTLPQFLVMAAILIAFLWLAPLVRS
jgi:TRAP-type mannitol/chloroaromatic compound transport system permease small subunit